MTDLDDLLRRASVYGNGLIHELAAAVRELQASSKGYEQDVINQIGTIDVLQAKLARYELAVSSLFDAIKHGDQEHQNWLKWGLDKHFSQALSSAQADAEGK